MADRDETLGQSSFFALVSRMKYIERWALMRSTHPENLSEHSLEVAVIAHALATIANVRYGRSLDAGKAALVGLFHDASEIITGDMPTPVKYANGQIRDAYKDVEARAERRLLDELPPDLAPAYEELFFPAADGDGAVREDDAYLRGLVKAADKISALIKCLDEAHVGSATPRWTTSCGSSCRRTARRWTSCCSAPRQCRRARRASAQPAAISCVFAHF